MVSNKNIKNLQDLSSQELQKFLNSFDLVLCDCDGVVWMGSEIPIPKAIEGIQVIKDQGKKVKFVSNNSLRSDSQYVAKFVELGMKDFQKDDILHPIKTMAWYLKNTYPHPIVYPLVAPTAIDALISYGIQVVPTKIDVTKTNIKEFTQYLMKHDPPSVDAVIVDICMGTAYGHLLKALQYLKDPKCELIFGATDATLSITKDFIIPGFVDFYEILMKYSKKEPIIAGKPSKTLENVVKHCFDITNPQRCIFIGDSLKSDIAFGNRAGFQTLFVSSGLDSEEAMFNAATECKPDFYTKGVADFINLFPFHSTLNMATKKTPKNLKQLTAEERKEFFNSFDLILSDCDGVVWMGSGVSMPGVGETIESLKSKGKQVKFVSNNSLRSNAEYVEKFTQLGVANFIESDIVHPAKTIAWYLKKSNPNATVYPLISAAAKDILRDHGLNVIPMNFDASNLNLHDFVKYVIGNEYPKADAVVADICFTTGYTHIVKALQYLKDPDCKLVLGAMDLFLPITSTVTLPGLVDFYEILKKNSSKDPIILGKPSGLLEHFLKETFTITNPERCLFIGDSLASDIEFGNNCGFQTLFVCGGVDTMETMLNASDNQRPNYYTDRFVDLKEMLSE
ncbi:uncharacterized protein LOC142231420 [Haematobia irritans]|uniref:uncharacterized protein LOC142231420 n=1 Tax=Haematobia irritans TaxID=7368 RepID=UPI003F4FEE8A